MQDKRRKWDLPPRLDRSVGSCGFRPTRTAPTPQIDSHSILLFTLIYTARVEITVRVITVTMITMIYIVCDFCTTYERSVCCRLDALNVFGRTAMDNDFSETLGLTESRNGPSESFPCTKTIIRRSERRSNAPRPFAGRGGHAAILFDICLNWRYNNNFKCFYFLRVIK